MKSLGITAFYRAPLGGLQENIRATAIHARNCGWDIRLALPDGPFLLSLEKAGFRTLPVDYQDALSVKAAADFIACVDVIHAHPGSKAVALAAATDAPLIYTVHGAWHDSIQQYAHRLASIICVSDAVRDLVVRAVGEQASVVTTIPNGVDVALFSEIRTRSRAPQVVIASRFDSDKRALVDLVAALWSAQIAAADRDVRWVVAGTGTQLEELRAAAEPLVGADGSALVKFAGWLEVDELAGVIRHATAAVAPGRSAMEALAMGLPTLAVGSAGASQVFTAGDLQKAARSNFGGYGSPPTDAISTDELWNRLHVAATQHDAAFSSEAANFVVQNFDNVKVNDAIVALYDEVLAGATMYTAARN